MSLDSVINFGKVTVLTGFNSAATSIVLASGHGARLPAASSGDSTTHYNIVCWNNTDHDDPADAYHASKAEIMRITNVSTDTLTVTRAQEGTTARNFNTGGKVYRLILPVTKKMIDDIDLLTLSVPRSYLAGLGLSNGIDTDHDIDIAIGKCRDDTDIANIVLSTILTKQIDAVWALGDDAGGLDTGTAAIDTWYHIFLIRRSDTGVVDALFSTSATVPTMPTNYDEQRRIGSILTDGSANIIAFIQTGDKFVWDVVVQDFSTANPGTSAVTRALTVPTGIAVIANFVFTAIDVTPAGINYMLVTSLEQTDTVPSGTIYTNATTIDAEYSHITLEIRTNTSGQIRTRTEVSNADIFMVGNTSGWTDRRGRDD